MLPSNWSNHLKVSRTADPWAWAVSNLAWPKSKLLQLGPWDTTAPAPWLPSWIPVPMATTSHWLPAGEVWTPLTPGIPNGLLTIRTATTKASLSMAPTTARTVLVPLLVAHLVTPLGLLPEHSGSRAPPSIVAAGFQRRFLTPSKPSSGWWIPTAIHPPCSMSPTFAPILGELLMSTAFPPVTTSFGALSMRWRRPELWSCLPQATRVPVQAPFAVRRIATRLRSPLLPLARSMAMPVTASLSRRSHRAVPSTATRSATALRSPTSVLPV